MSEISDKIALLIVSHLKGELTPEGSNNLRDWMAASAANQAIAEEFLNEISLKEGILDMLSKELVWQRLKENTANKQLVHRVHFLKTAWFRYAAAIIAIAAIGTYLWIGREKQPVAVANQHLNSNKPPQRNNATLTLADGSVITLSDAANGTLAQQGNTKIIKLDAGQVSYNLQGNILKGMETYNTISTPKGSQYQIVLPDGSKVWLNAASSIKFPTAFTAATRSIEVMGEAYFEIAKNSRQPFFVKTGEVNIQVLGTVFNINAYTNEEAIKTTLVEGSVKVKTGKEEALLKPGQQAQVSEIKDITVVAGPDIIEQALAWKQGVFNFNGLGIKEVMNQLQRWYDIEVFYEAGIPDIKFLGKMGKDIDLSAMLEILKVMGVQYRLEGKKLIVTQKNNQNK